MHRGGRHAFASRTPADPPLHRGAHGTALESSRGCTLAVGRRQAPASRRRARTASRHGAINVRIPEILPVDTSPSPAGVASVLNVIALCRTNPGPSSLAEMILRHLARGRVRPCCELNSTSRFNAVQAHEVAGNRHGSPDFPAGRARPCGDWPTVPVLRSDASIRGSSHGCG